MTTARFRILLPVINLALFALLIYTAQPREIHYSNSVSEDTSDDEYQAEPTNLIIAIVLDAPGGLILPVVPLLSLVSRSVYDLTFYIWGIGIVLQWFVIGDLLDRWRGLPELSFVKTPRKCSAFFCWYTVAVTGVALCAVILSFTQENFNTSLPDVVMMVSTSIWSIVILVAVVRWRNVSKEEIITTLLG